MDTVAGHVRAAYPDRPADSVAADRDAIVGNLASVGVLGVAGWAWTLRLLTRNVRRARAVATALFGLGVLITLTNLTYGAGPYDTVAPTAYGLLGLLPVLVGTAAVAQLWRGPTSHS